MTRAMEPSHEKSWTDPGNPHLSETSNERTSLASGREGGFLNPWRDYVDANRDVFMDEIVSFIGTSNRQELAAIRAAVQQAARTPCKGAKRGRPRGSKVSRPKAEGAVPASGVGYGPDERDHHGYFRDICMVCGDTQHLRPIFLGQIVLLLHRATRRELALARKAVAERGRSRGILKKRGRPSVQDDDELSYKSRLVAWRRIIDKWSTERIAGTLGMRITKTGPRHKGNIEGVRWTLRRLENYLAAKIWEAMHPSWVMHLEDGSRVPKPGILDHKPVQQCLWTKTGLPFREHPDECKRIVLALWPNALGAAVKMTEQRFRYMREKS